MFTSDLPPVSVGGSSVPAEILEACRRHPTEVALIDDTTDRRLTYKQLAQRVDRVGAAVSDRSLGRGDTVAFWAPNSADWLTMALGVMAAGATVTAMSPLVTDPEVARHLQATRPAMLVTAPPLVDRALAAAVAETVTEVVVIDERATDRAPLPGRPVVTAFDDLLRSQGASADVGAIRGDDIAILPMSSGTSGVPKAVEITHDGLVTQFRQISAATPIGTGDRVLALPPFSYVMGSVFTGLWPLSQGAGVVTTPKFNPDRFLPAIAQRRLTMIVVPPMLAGLLASHPGATTEAMATVRLLGFGGAPSSPDLLGAVATRFPQIVVGQGYGLTELSCVAATTRLYDPVPVGSVGRLVPNTQLRVVDPSSGDDLGEDEVGELWVRGPQVMAGYRNDPEKTAATVDADGWLHTGDLGCIDGDGNIYVIERIKELIKVKGHQVAPAELEQVLLGNPSVTDAAVTSVVVDGDERPVAFVVTRDNQFTPDDLGEWVAERVAPYKRLQAVHTIDAIPRNSNGKILRRVLREEVRV